MRHLVVVLGFAGALGAIGCTGSSGSESGARDGATDRARDTGNAGDGGGDGGGGADLPSADVGPGSPDGADASAGSDGAPASDTGSPATPDGRDGATPDSTVAAPDAMGASPDSGGMAAPDVARDQTAPAPDLMPDRSTPVPDGPVVGGDGPAAPSSGCVPNGRVLGGMERLIDLFVVEQGLIVVRHDALVLVGRDGAVKTTRVAPRPITTASLEGSYLAVADGAKVTAYDLALNPLGDVLLTEACAASVIVGDGIFVCGPANDWDRVFYTYDLQTRTALARSSKKYTYNGIPMRRIPGTNHFITVTVGTIPPDFHLYRVEPSGDVVFVNESPYHGGFPATMVFGYAGTPVSHLVNVDGMLLRIFGDKCTETESSFTSGCFVKDGDLGTLWMGETFASLSNDAAGGLYAVVSSERLSFFDPPCRGGCAVQQIDVARRTVVSQRKHVINAKHVLVSRPDPTCRMLAVGYEVVGANPSSFEWSGYEVALLDYRTP